MCLALEDIPRGSVPKTVVSTRQALGVPVQRSLMRQLWLQALALGAGHSDTAPGINPQRKLSKNVVCQGVLAECNAAFQSAGHSGQLWQHVVIAETCSMFACSRQRLQGVSPVELADRVLQLRACEVSGNIGAGSYSSTSAHRQATTHATCNKIEVAAKGSKLRCNFRQCGLNMRGPR